MLLGVQGLGRKRDRANAAATPVHVAPVPTPPLPLGAAQVRVQVLTLAFLVVGATCLVMIPIMLYMLGLRNDGWTWAHACMFGAMTASTDAVAIVAVMKTSECCARVGGELHTAGLPVLWEGGEAAGGGGRRGWQS